MSLDHTTGAPDGEHLDEEATSAALDEEATPDERAHLERCATCQASVARLRATQAAVAAPVRLDPHAREAAVVVALAVYDDARAERPPVPRAGEVRTLPRRGAGGSRRAAVVPWLGVAAVLLLIVLAVPLLRGAGGGATSTEADTEAAGGATAADEAAGDSSASAPAPPVDVGDLGEIEVGEDLRPVVDAALGAGRDQETTSNDRATASSGGGAEPGERASDEEAESDEGAEPREVEEPAGAEESGEVEESGEAEEESAPETSNAPEAPAGPEGAARAGPAEDAFREARATCEPTVRAALPEAGALVLVGSGTVGGAPALVFGFAGPSERPAVLTALVRREGCELVTFQSYVLG